MRFIDWVVEQRIPHVKFVCTINGNGEKVPINIPSGWMEWDYDKCLSSNESKDGYETIALNLTNSKWMCIDVDEPKFEKIVLDIYGTGWQTKSSRLGLPHLYRLKHPDDPAVDEINKDNTKVDYLYHQVWEDINGEMTPAPAPNLQVYESDWTIAPTSSKSRTCSPKAKTEEDMIFKKRILDNIALEHWDDRESWKRLIYAMQSEEISEETMEHYSKRSSKYKDGCVQDLLKDWDVERSTSWGTVEHFSRLSNSDEHIAICRKLRPRTVSIDSGISTGGASGSAAKDSGMKRDVSTDKFLALKALELTDGDIIKDAEHLLYVFNPKTGLWLCDRKGCHTRVAISNLLDEWCCDQMDMLHGLSHDEYKKQSSPILKAKDKVNANSGINNVYSVFCDTIPIKKIEFDNVSPYLFVWKCGKAYCFKTHEFVVPKKSDYVSMTTGYAFEQYNDEDLTSLQDLYREIHFHEDTYNPYMSLCVTACIGLQVEHLIICTGVGGNGKGVVNGLLDALLGNYFYAGAVATLQQPIKAEQANPALASMHKKRVTIFTEPKAGKKLDQSTVKALTGDGKINARQLYSGDNQLINHNSIIMECNELPLIDGKMDESISRRVVAIPFEATYKNADDPDVLAGVPHVHAKNILYKTRAWQVQHRSALFEMIRRFSKEHGTELLQTLKTKAYGKNYVMSSVMAGEWFRERYERVPEDSEELEPIPIKMLDLFNDFKETDEYRILDRDEKKYWTKRRITDHLQNSLPKGDVKERGKLYDVPYKKSIWNWKLISE